MKDCKRGTVLSRYALVWLLLLLVTSLGACVKTVKHPQLDVTFLPRKGEFISKYGDHISLTEIIEMARAKDYILIGEGHKNKTDHNVQQRLLAALADADTPPVVGLEMIAVDMKPVLDDFCDGMVSVADLERELQWKTKWGYPYDLFEGLFEIANRNSLPVAGLNVPTAVTRKIADEGLASLSEEEKALLPRVIVPPSQDQLRYLEMVLAQHEGKDAEDPVEKERFLLVQSIWDSKMAEEAVRLHHEYEWPVYVVAGAGHVEFGWGIAKRIRQFDPSAKVLSIMPWRGGEFDQDEADVFFYSPDSYDSRMGALLVATGRGGLLVERVKRGSRAEKAGLRPGDVLVEAAGIPLEYLMSLHVAGSKVYKANEELIFTVRRGGETFTANVGKLSGMKQKKAAAQTEKATPEDGASNVQDGVINPDNNEGDR